MTPKQDRSRVRTAPDLERKYKFQDVSDIAKTAINAQAAATNAQNVAYSAASEAASAKATAEKLATGLSVVDGLLCITYEG